MAGKAGSSGVTSVDLSVRMPDSARRADVLLHAWRCARRLLWPAGMSLHPAATLSDFMRQPIGRFWIGDQLMVWASGPSLVGVTLWGAPSHRALALVLECLDAPLPSGIAAPCNVVFDVRRVVAVDVSIFDQLLAAINARRAVCERSIGRQVIVRPSGVIGALAEGFAGLFGPRYGWAVVDSYERAFAWLALGPTPHDLATLDAIVEAALAQSASLARLRGWLAEHPHAHRVGAAAAALGTSTRSLQRALHLAGTSFKEESDRVRTERALHWLSLRADKVEAIARQLGFMTSSSFASFLRRRTGQSPQELRRARTRAG